MTRHRRKLTKSPRPSPATEVPRSRSPLSVVKKLQFSLIVTVLFFLALELILMIAGWQPILYEDDPYVGFFGLNPLFVETTGPDGTLQLVTAPNKTKWFNQQRFARQKAANAYRVFCLGGSTTYGRPYDDRTSFAGWLRELLPEVDGNRQWEVINAGGISYASYRVANVMQELLEYDPDLFVIYSGHNEFLEARTYGDLADTPGTAARLDHVLSHTRTYTLMRRLVKGPERNIAPQDLRSRPNLLPSEVNTLLDSALGPEVYHRDDELRTNIVAHYDFNLRRMVDMARLAGAEVILVTPASNLSNCSPFKSEHRGDWTAALQREWESSRARADELFKSGDLEGAMRAVNRAVDIDPRYADSLYLRARIRLALGQAAAAREDFVAGARRTFVRCAPNELLQAVRRVAAETRTLHVDFAEYVDRASPNGIPGENLFLDHVHLTIEGYRDLASLLIASMRDAGIVASPTELEPGVLSHRDRPGNGASGPQGAQRGLAQPVESLELGRQERGSGRFGVAHLQLEPNDAETQYQAGNAYVRRGEFDEGIRCYQRTRELNPEYAASVNASLGFAHAAKGDQDQAMTYYLTALAVNPQFGDVHYNLAVIYDGRGEAENAIRHYRSAIASQPQHFLAHNQLGILLAEQQKLDEAQVQFQQALRINPNSVDARLHLGQVLARQGRTSLAREQFLWVLRQFPQHPVAGAELERLK